MTPEEKAVLEAALAYWGDAFAHCDGDDDAVQEAFRLEMRHPHNPRYNLFGAIARTLKARAEAPAKPEVTLRRYRIPSQNWEGWAYIVIGSDGYFSTVSDYGNYSFWWSHHGCADFREFLLRGEQSWEYFANKLCPGRVYDGEATARAIRHHILEARRGGDMDRDEAREEWCKVDDNGVDDDVNGFITWQTDTHIEAPSEFHRDSINPQIEAFMKNVWPRFNAVLREELARDGAA